MKGKICNQMGCNTCVNVCVMGLTGISYERNGSQELCTVL
jgi:hypothetical protein